ncbi:glyoxalase family protein [Burkholderia thailandensis]|uniref:Glyoxalase family protein n=1 Tax=Burkholderia thailandensis TaxID=57975 RepID=A0AAW9D2V3_BURTH|nr:glyoxalase family protein [Burkholderia thailandensis]
MTDPRPADVPWLTPYLTVRSAHASIQFLATRSASRSAI